MLKEAIERLPGAPSVRAGKALWARRAGSGDPRRFLRGARHLARAGQAVQLKAEHMLGSGELGMVLRGAA